MTEDLLREVRNELARMNQSDGEYRKEMLDAIGKVDLRVTGLYAEIESKFVRREYLDAVLFPIKAFVYGLASLTLTAVVGAIIALVLRTSR